MRRGDGWLATHPDRDLIVRRYLKQQARLFFPALAQLDEAAPTIDGVDERAASHARRAAFVGDYGDRGPNTPNVLKLVIGMVSGGTAICLPSNHDAKLVRKLNGRDVPTTHGPAQTLDQLEAEPEEFRAQARDFLDKLVSHVVLDDGEPWSRTLA